jgi:hypothetical protein
MDATPPAERLHPVLRSLVPTLLAAAAAEMIVSRLLTQGSVFWPAAGSPDRIVAGFLDHLAFTLFNFSMVMAVGVLALMGIAGLVYGAGIGPLGRALATAWVGFAFWGLFRAYLNGPLAQALFSVASLLLALIALAPLFGGASRTAARAFTVLLGASLACGAVAAILEALGGPGTAGPTLVLSARRAGELLALAAGAVATALVPFPDPESDSAAAFPPALLAALPAAAFFLMQASTGRSGVTPRWTLGWLGEHGVPPVLGGLVHATVMFLFLFAVFRALADPRWRIRGYGLGFLFIAGIQYRIAYQHLLALIGLLLLTRGAVPEAVTPANASPPPREPARAPGPV